MPAVIHLVYGPQGAGKTTHARTLTAQTQGVRFSIDEWMVTLFEPDLRQPLDFSWVMARIDRCQAQIWTLTQQLVDVNTPVILDLGFMRTEDRQLAMQRAKDCGASAVFHFVDAPLSLRRERVLHRNEAKGETFALVVSPTVFDFMETLYQAPSPSELAQARQVTSSYG